MTGAKVVDNGKNQAWQLIYGGSTNEIAKMMIGQGTTDPTATDTELENPIPINPSEVLDVCDSATGWAGNISGNIITYWDTVPIEGAACLNLQKSNTTTTTYYAEKTLSSTYDWTSKKLYVYVRTGSDFLNEIIQQTGTAFHIRFGSDSSNYWEITKTKADFSAGWNLLVLDTTNATETGTCDNEHMDYLRIGYETKGAIYTTWGTDEGSLMIDYIFLATYPDDYLIDFLAGYPTYDTVNKRVTSRAIIATSQANGTDISEVGTFTVDGTIMFSRDTFTPIVKNNQIRLILEITHTFE